MMFNSCTEEQETSNFYLKLSYFIREQSKDSNSQNTSLTIRNKIIEYSVSHGGCDPRADIKKDYKLTAELEQKLIKYVKENKLNQNIQERTSNASLGISVSLLLEIKIDNSVTKSDISGAVNIWGARKTNKKTIESKDYYHKIHSLLVFMKSDLGFKEIEI